MRIYLATPYTSPDPVLEHQRYQQACRIAGEIMLRGHVVFSPIAHSHPIAVRCALPGTHAFWQAQNAAWIEWADELWLVMMDGWDQSAGVKWEIGYAQRAGKGIAYYPAYKGGVDARESVRQS